MKLSIIFPAYNEEKRILPVLTNYYYFLEKKFKQDFELIIIPNNCQDNTLKVVQDFAKEKKNIRVFNIQGYSGKGGAVMKGFELARGDFIGFTDSDTSVSPEKFFKLYTHIKDFSGAIASRKIKGAIVSPPRRKTQDFSSWLFNRFVRILFGLGYYDTQCGAKLFKKDVAKLLQKNCTEFGWGFDVDLLYICKKNNFKIIEIPIFWKDSLGSSLTIRQGMISLLKLFRYRLKN